MGFDASLLTGASVLTAAQSPGSSSSSSSSGGVPVATWPLANARWYALDGTNGFDTNIGFSDVSSAQAGLVAKKTVAGLAAVLPRNGANRKVVIVVAAGTYADSIDTLLQGLEGYALNALIVGTVTNATSGSVAFAGDANDRTQAGFVVVPGLNAGGYNPTGVPTTTAMTLQINGGGAPALPAEPAAPLGWRIRFDSNAPTQAALRGVCRTVVGVPTNASLTYTVLPAAPLTTDVVYLEKAGVVFSAGRNVFVSMGSTAPNFASGFTAGFQLVGLDLADNLRLGSGRRRWAGCRFGGAANAILRAEIEEPGPTYTDETGTTRTVGAGLRVDGTIQYDDATNVSPLGQQSCVFVGQAFITRATVASLGASSYFGSGLLIDETVMPLQAFNAHALFNAVGNITIGTTTPNPCRLTGVIAANAGFRSAIQICVSQVSLAPITITGVGAFPCIQLIGRSIVSLDGRITGSTGNTDVGLDLTQASNSLVFLPNGNPTVTGTNGDVRLSDGNVISWAQAGGGIIDAAGNQIVSLGSTPIAESRLSYAGFFVNDPVFTAGGGASAELPAGYSTVMNAVSWRYNIGRYVTTIKLCYNVLANSLAGGGASFTINVLKNGVVVGTSAPIPSGSTPAAQAVMILAATLGASNRNTDVYSLQLTFANVTANVANTVELTASIVGNGCY